MITKEREKEREEEFKRYRAAWEEHYRKHPEKWHELMERVAKAEAFREKLRASMAGEDDD